MKITKQYIDENLLTKRGLNSNLTGKLSQTTEELYLIYHDTEASICLGNNKAYFQSFTKGYRLTCGSKKCECYKDRYKRTQETVKKTNPERYGVECNFSLKENKLKEKATKLEKYGSEGYNNSASISETLLNKTDKENKIAHEKSKITRLEKYGNATYRNIDAQKSTKLEIYGDENYNNHKEGQPKRRKTLEKNGSWIPLNQISDWELYKRIVRKLTEINYTLYKNKINPNNFLRVLNGEEGHQLDHIISVQEGFLNNVPSYIIASEDNLQMLTWSENRTKWY